MEVIMANDGCFALTPAEEKKIIEIVAQSQSLHNADEEGQLNMSKEITNLFGQFINEQKQNSKEEVTAVLRKTFAWLNTNQEQLDLHILLLHLPLPFML